MRNLLSAIGRFLTELRRRKVYQVALAYVVVGFMVIEAADLTLVRLGLPSWTVTLVVALVGLGFPIALVLAWALEVTPEGIRVEEADEPSGQAARPASSPRDLWVGASVLMLLLLGAWWMWGGLSSENGSTHPSGTPEIERRTIAVLPFEVSGAGAEEWRDGMVTMLSMNLDGAAGFRAISDRAVFAAWKKRGKVQEGLSPDSALAVAREVGAKCAVVGSAVQLGEDLRLGAEVRRVGSGTPLGEVEVEGATGDITTLTDELTRKVLGVLLGRSAEAIPSVDLASITTSSLEALKSFLDGERHFRAGRYEAAVEDFKLATRQDSTFALAYKRLGRSAAWAGEDGVQDAVRTAYQLSDRLSPREQRLIWARHARLIENRALAATDSLRALTEVYPDDPNVWYQLGETLFHGAVPGGWPEADQAFERAVELDPGVAPYNRHLMDLAFSLHNDSARAARRIEAHPEGRKRRLYQALWDLNFGAKETRQAAWARLDTMALSGGPPSWIQNVLSHPTDLTVQARVIERLGERMGTGVSWYGAYLFRNHLDRGQIDPAISLARKFSEGWSPLCYWEVPAVSLGYPVPDSLLRPRLEPPHGKPLPCVSMYLVEKGRPDETGAVHDRLRDQMEHQGVAKELIETRLNELRGYRAWKTGDLQQAETLWSGAKSDASGVFGALWRGDLYRELGELEKAEGWYLGAWRHPLTHERLGMLYEKMGRPEKAAAAYERFIAAWKNADPELQSRVEKARRRVEILRGKRAAE